MAAYVDDPEDDKIDDYWNTSSRSARTKTSNFFDDFSPNNDERSVFGADKSQALSFKETMKAAGLGLDEDDEDQDTIIGWDGKLSSVKFSTKGAGQSAPPRPSTLPPSARGTVNASPRPASTGSSPYPMGTSSSITSARRQSGGTRNGAALPAPSPGQSDVRPHSASFSTEGTEKRALDERSTHSTGSSSASIEDAIKRDSKPTLAEVSKLQAEVQALRRKLKSVERGRWEALPVADTVTRIITGEPYSLEPYRSLQDKLSLLDAAIGYHDGNAILTIVMFLKRTLSKAVFCEEIRRRQVAASQYIAFIKKHKEKRDIVASEMGELGRIEDAALWRYKEATENQIPHGQLMNLKEVHSLCFDKSTTLATEAEYIKEHIDLLNRQLQIEAVDEKAQREGRQPFKECPRKSSILFKSVITTLFYCCYYHYGEPEVSMSSPLALRQFHKLTEKQYLFTALLSRIKLRRWLDLDALLTSKNWRGKTMMKSAVKFEQVVEILVEQNAPHDALDKYLKLIEDPESRICLATKLDRHAVVVDALIQVKDRQRLLKYQSKVPQGTPEARRIEDIMRNSTFKWKN
ncbi:spermatogenesis-defective protein 39 homolog [Acanthaster planci]|uniref:Spermatogenesis-defective protein 39 homolog n=1 Tax=Acanthaster planci TaxID=133434 RepID=A0A8B7YQ68_ACAPL|nr:spermatogenesis-defective protein 39 homolog [Acanthaster planci]